MTILKTEDVARELNTSKRWVYDHVYELGGVKIGKKVIITREGLNDALQGKRGMERNGYCRKPKDEIRTGAWVSAPTAEVEVSAAGSTQRAVVASSTL